MIAHSRSLLSVVVDRGETLAEGRDDGRREEVGPHENGCGGGSSGAAIGGMSERPTATVVTTTNRLRSRRSRADTTPRAAPTRVHHANAGIGMAVSLISRLTSAARDGSHDGGADGRDCARERTASNKAASARLVGLHARLAMHDERRQRSHPATSPC